jgi:hypothetical protein
MGWKNIAQSEGGFHDSQSGGQTEVAGSWMTAVGMAHLDAGDGNVVAKSCAAELR